MSFALRDVICQYNIMFISFEGFFFGSIDTFVFIVIIIILHDVAEYSWKGAKQRYKGESVKWKLALSA